jgi:tRNA/tmRNA/rRNA uracil-C5-methylase (TrmA/RlmC/RlmD family)
VKEIIPSLAIFGYRGKAEYHVGFSKGETPGIGFMDVEGSKLVDIERCEIVDETISQSFQDFRKELIADRTKIRNERQVIWSGLSDKEKPAGTSEYVTRMVKDKSLEGVAVDRYVPPDQTYRGDSPS